MPPEGDHVRRIRRLGHKGLLTLWSRIEAGTTVDDSWPAGKAFELLLLRQFEREGAAVQWPYEVRLGEDVIEQIDGAIHLLGLSCVCESKDYAQPINVEPIAKLRNQLLRRPAGAMGLIFSRNGFTDPALALARFVAPQTILLWHGDEIGYALRHEKMIPALQAKYRHAVEQGLPDLDIRFLTKE